MDKWSLWKLWSDRKKYELNTRIGLICPLCVWKVVLSCTPQEQVFNRSQQQLFEDPEPGND